MISPDWRPSQPYFMGVWSILVGLFLLDTAAKVVKSAPNAVPSQQSVMRCRRRFRSSRSLTITQLIDDILPLHRQTSFPVAVNQQLHGILALEDLKSLPRERWRKHARPRSDASDRPRFSSNLRRLSITPVTLMKSNGVGSVAVVNNRGRR